MCAAGMAGSRPVGRGQEGGRLSIRAVDGAYCMDDMLGKELEAWGPACLTCRYSRPCASGEGREAMRLTKRPKCMRGAEAGLVSQ